MAQLAADVNAWTQHLALTSTPARNVGTQAIAAAPAEHRRWARHQRPTRLAPTTPRLTLDHDPARRPRPARGPPPNAL